MRKVEIKPFNEQWFCQYEEEKERLIKIFGIEVLAIHHIGSTSVKGLKAKPIIDILVVVKEITRVDVFNDAMREIGYEAKGENGIPKRRYFQKGGDFRTHHVHIYQVGDVEIDRHLVFRDYLRMYPKIAEQYGNLKEKLAKQYLYEIAAYSKGKEKFVLDVEREALIWSENRMNL